MVFCNSRCRPGLIIGVIDDCELEQVDEFVYLGCTLTKNGKFTLHKKALIKKLKTSLFLNLGFSKQVFALPPAIKDCIYKTRIRSIMDFSAPIIPFCQWKQLETLQNESGRRVLSCPKRTPCAAIRGDLGWWSLLGRRCSLRLNFWHHILSRSPHSILHTVYQYTRSELLQYPNMQNSWIGDSIRMLVVLDIPFISFNEHIVGWNSQSDWKSFVKDTVQAYENQSWIAEVAELRRMGPARILADYTWEKIAGQYNDLFLEVSSR